MAEKGKEAWSETPLANQTCPICGYKHASLTEARACHQRWSFNMTAQDRARAACYLSCCFSLDPSYEAGDED